MKKIFFVLTILGIISCNKINKDDLIGLEFNDFKAVNPLETFTKISDTSFSCTTSEPKFKLFHLKDGKQHLVVFADILKDSENNFKVLDILEISNLTTHQKISIGYCEFDLKHENNGNLIAVVNIQDNEDIFVQTIRKAWVANPESRTINSIKDISQINCINEWYNGKNSKINYNLLKH
ncbi:conserved hypothetical protein [Formosa agariphila KMM 3901]|uniref:Lipoprotein n=1 Tax=Formosa agariphila (strain DSM 15362 / KCTC 12365 / LMG 23005 / KMM 3901 / M-2Alg 35-1) TaxID=1347342 RepID=T2KIR2_FORAG|nr:hypothetical protein [Formosa agariphila]CDF78700.1 conserved hypothetical protein [Formosa agariphila KMM 3901]